MARALTAIFQRSGLVDRLVDALVTQPHPRLAAEPAAQHPPDLLRLHRRRWSGPGRAGADVLHSARSVIASRLCSAKEPMALFQRQAWPGHRSPRF
jgi:hypothetical protein